MYIVPICKRLVKAHIGCPTWLTHLNKRLMKVMRIPFLRNNEAHGQECLCSNLQG